MLFTYYPREGLIKSEDPAVYVEIVPWVREPGRRFVFYFRGRSIGFQTKNVDGEEQVRQLPDGTLVWRIHDVGAPIYTWDLKTKARVLLTNTQKFFSEQEQNQVLEIFSSALAVFDAGHQVRDSRNPKASVEYTPELLEKISRGELIE